jgi:hypothetical protein
MKPVHDKRSIEDVTPGHTYVVGMNGTNLYEGTVTKFHGGCWATIRVEKAIDGPMAPHYQPGMEFDIKVANYTLVPV